MKKKSIDLPVEEIIANSKVLVSISHGQVYPTIQLQHLPRLL
jgi:hypothetical protein